MLKEPAYRSYWQERLGSGSTPPKPWSEAPLKLWVHAVSLGETRAIAPLIISLAQHYPNAQFLLTHSTPTGRHASETLIRPSLKHRLNVRYLPYDVPILMSCFISHWQPSLCLLAETELWPRLMHCTHTAHIPTYLINARLSKRSARRYAHFRPLTYAMLQSLSCVLSQDRATLRRFRVLGFSGPASVLGNLKFDPIPPSPEHITLGQTLRLAWKNNPHRIILASSRPGEENDFIKSIQKFKESLTPQQSVAITIVPRHIERCSDIQAAMQRFGWHVVRKSTWHGETLDPATTLLLGDTIGELVAYYKANDSALLGGSFGNYGAQNPLEALASGCTLLIGRSRFNFQSIVHTALQHHAAISVNTMDEALNWIRAAIDNPTLAHTLQKNGFQFCESQRGTLQRYTDALTSFIDTL